MFCSHSTIKPSRGPGDSIPADSSPWLTLPQGGAAVATIIASHRALKADSTARQLGERTWPLTVDSGCTRHVRINYRTGKGMTKKAVPIVFLVALSLIFLGECKSVPERVRELSDNSYFTEAATVIAGEQDKLAKNPDLKKLKELDQARQIFEESVSVHFGSETEKLNSQGKVREALKVSIEAGELCPWSAKIQSMVMRFKNKVAVLDQLQEKWHDQIASGQLSPTNSRLVILDLSNVLSEILDSPDLVALNANASKGVILYWANKLKEDRLRLTSTDESDLSADIHRVLPDRAKADGLEGAIRTLQDLINPISPNSGRPNQENLPIDVIGALYQESSATSFDARTLPIRQVLQSEFEDWVQAEYSRTLLGANVSFDTIKQSEYLVETVVSIRTSLSFRHALAVAHINRARQLLKGGVSSVLALFFLRRAAQIEDPSANAAEIDNIGRSARSYLSTTKYPDFSLSMDIDPAIQLDTQGIVFSAFSNSFLSRSKEDRPWRLVSSDATDKDVSIEIDSAEIDVPELSKLPRVTSQYFSHYESVPNPAKEALKFQISLQEISVESAKRSYEYAVSSYNINPTDWGLNEVNSDYNNYKWAIDRYNTLVDSYNLTPSTVEQPVNLPYSFVQGDVSFGCRLSVKVKVGEQNYRFSSKSIDACFIRRGTKPTDINQLTRRDIGFTFDLSFRETTRASKKGNRRSLRPNQPFACWPALPYVCRALF